VIFAVGVHDRPREMALRSADLPLPAVQAKAPDAGLWNTGWVLVTCCDDHPEAIVAQAVRRPAVSRETAKPVYHVPTLAEIMAGPRNGFTVASSFSGAGGSSCGYWMAGFTVGWASEFVPEAAETYRANWPAAALDTRDIRDVQPADVLAALSLKAGELDIWDGSPPCASFSMAGNREADWGKVKAYSGTRQRTDDLFYEYARMVEGIMPRVFIAENVAGLVRGTAKGYFKRILARLQAAGYRVKAFKLDASWLGVPQARQRIMFVGVRADLGMDPVCPAPLPYRYSVRDALPHIVMQGDNGGFGAGAMRPATVPSPTIASSVNGGNSWFAPSRVVALQRYDGERSVDEPAPTIMSHNALHTRNQIVARVIHDTSGERGQGDITDQPAPTITPGAGGINSHHFQLHGAAADDMTDPETGQDLRISTFAVGREWARLRPGEKSGRYWNLWRLDPGAPSPAVAAQAGRQSASGTLTHGEICRKLNLQELRALSSFPPDFVLTGSYVQRWERIGRAVPPVMMAALAGAIRDQILIPLREAGKI
jgi:DNA (cytosine-5)-methyltransferase 1